MYVILHGLVITGLVALIGGENCESVDGVRQSPINIDTFTVIPVVSTALRWSSSYSEQPEGLQLVSNGETLRLTANHSGSPPTISGWLLDVPYEFQQLHFHWGDADDKGSEHKINGKSYPVEMHVVHTQTSNDNIDQYVVVAYFFRPARRINKALQQLLDVALLAAETRDEPMEVNGFPLSELVNTNPFSYYTYKGSLTTPPYTESVTWIIASTALPIADSQVEILRRAAQIDPELNDNFRCLQKINDRQIRYVVPLQG